MEQPYLSSQLDYLEQKNQEAQSQIAKLQQRVELQEYQLQEQAHKITEGRNFNNYPGANAKAEG